MRTIKFRGVTSKGKIVYGYAFKYFKQKSWYILDERAEQWKIKSESLAQLVGYDKNEKEVYEGDTLIDDDGQEFAASLQGIVRWETDDKSKYADMPDHLKTVPFDFAQKFTPLTLKGQAI